MKKSEVDKFVDKSYVEITFKDGTMIFTASYPFTRACGGYYFITVNEESLAYLAKEIKTIRIVPKPASRKGGPKPVYKLCSSCKGSGTCKK